MLKNQFLFFTVLINLIIISGTSCQREYSSERLVEFDKNVFPETEEKIKFLEERIALNPNNPENYYLKAEALRTSGEYTDALEQIDKALALDSSDGNYYLLKADVLHKKGFVTRSLFFALKAENKLPYSPELRSVLASNYLELEKPSLARTSIEDAKKLQPANAEFHLLSGEIALVEGDTGRAINDFNKAIKMDSKLISGPLKLIQISLEQGKVEEALKYFDQFPQSTISENEELNYLFIKTKLASGDADFFFSKVDSLKNRGEFNVLLIKQAGDWMKERRKYLSSIEYYERIPETSAQWIPASLSKAESLSILGRTKEALAVYNNIIERFPDNEEAIAGKEAIEEKIALYLRWQQRQRRIDSLSSQPLKPKSLDLNN
ncbi:tetratricopeptide repeat protein [Mangrovivirga sp. M17]|uniref:Tetratricopeptide repeat protein n=1 Tax=Mangrovivirga halotolerans TaxID=2993936 RepID=A0ABT3RRV6_9BACT|nr:tetratricopeptide repeat protein [Mangrovivirga halotolerans]MCX2744346.1 tetratricopeptide repeat protein [Mangrovivirga halotolerans]